MERLINEHLVQITGKACIDGDLGDYGDDVILIVKGSITHIEGRDNHDGSIDKVFKVKQIECEKYESNAESKE